ncbi:MAG: glycosyltransferase [Dysgonamonadaceae bacterium]|jgi:glycosyltransferase involved in cell wall biosynthesis|nr:glycosyltransferase [Dysgonamonadaceae bacterium]
MPVYNVEKYVERALLSALNQTYKNIEFIIVDDRGSDNSMEIVRRIISGHPRGKQVRIIEHERNIGLGAGRNTAIENAEGKYLFFMDSDDKISPDCIDKLYAKMQEENVDFVEGSCQMLLQSGEIIGDLFIYTCPNLKGHLEVARQFFEKRNQSLHIALWNRLYQLSFLRNNRILCNSNHLNEDIIFSFQVFFNAFSCSFIPDITYFYYDTPDSIMKKMQSKNIPSRLGLQYAEISSFYRKYAQKYRNENIYESILYYITNHECFYAIRINDSIAIPKSEKKKFLKTTTKFPVNFKEIAKLKKKKLFFYIMWLIFKMPFNVSLFKLILWLSDKKEKRMICPTRQDSATSQNNSETGRKSIETLQNNNVPGQTNINKLEEIERCIPERTSMERH